MGTGVSEINVPSTKDPELSYVLSLKPGVGQTIAMDTSLKPVLNWANVCSSNMLRTV